MPKPPIRGSCLCGTVRYEFDDNLGVFQYCHCSRCRKVTGSAHAANIFVPPDRFRWLAGEEALGRYELPEAKHFATGFCKQCGSNLPWLSKSGRTMVIPAGTLDDDPGIRPHQNIHCASQADWYVEAADLPKHPGLPPRK